jgi:hypothetical protein
MNGRIEVMSRRRKKKGENNDEGTKYIRDGKTIIEKTSKATKI